MPSSSGRGIHGPRPQALKVSKEALKVTGKSPAAITGGGGGDSSGGGKQSPAIFYLRSPKVVHARPQDFMTVVQRLTGKEAGESERSPEKSGFDGGNGEEDPILMLTLGQSPSASAWAAGARSSGAGSMASPAGRSSPAGSMASPAWFSLSPNLKACLQEFGTLF